MPVNISINTNTIAIQENINHISVNDPNNPNIVDITQPITEIVEIITAGPQGPIGPSGSAGPPGSAVLSGGTNDFIPLWSGSTNLTSSIARQASGTLQISGSTSITGSLNVTNGITGSLFGSASYSASSSRAISSSYATTASYVLQAVSSSYTNNALSASYALTASYALNAGTTINTGSFVTTSSFNSFTSSYNTGSFTGSFTGSLFGTSSYALSASQAISALTASFAPNYVLTSLTSSMTVATSSYATTAGNGGVTQIIAGTNIILSPTNGLGQVTVNATGGSSFNTATGSYGSFYDTGSVLATSATQIYSMSLSNTDLSNGVFVSSSNGDITKIAFTNAGIYNIQFSAQFSNSDNSTQDVVVWIRKNGTDIEDSSGTVGVPPFKAGSNGQALASWNYYLSLSANDYVQMCWHVEQANVVTLETIAAGTSPTHPRTPSLILTAQRVDTFLSNTGSFSGSFQGSFSGSFTGSISNAVSASYALTASYALNGGGGGNTFPYTGSALITGSLKVIGPVNIPDSLTQGVEGNIASGTGSHAEGIVARALGEYSHAEGSNTTAEGASSHAEGEDTIARGGVSHAEGRATLAQGEYSHAEGNFTIAAAYYQHTQGQYNITSSVAGAFIHGNGTSNETRSNLIYAHDSVVEITGSLGVTGPTTVTSNFGYGTSSVALTVDNTTTIAEGDAELKGTGIAGTGEYGVIGYTDAGTGVKGISTQGGIGVQGTSTDVAGVGVSAIGETGLKATGSVTAIEAIGPVSITGNTSITGSLKVSGSITGSLFGTASYATNAVTASYVNRLNQNVIITGSLTVENPSGDSLLLSSTGNSLVVTSSQGTAAQVVGGNNGNNIALFKSIPANSTVVTISSTGNIFTSGSLTATQGITGSLFGTSSFALTASNAPNYVLTSTTSSMTVLSSSFAISSSRAVSSSYALTASYVIGGGGGAATPIKLKSQTILSSSWVATGNYYTSSFTNPNITITCDISVTPQPSSYQTAYNAQILPYVEVIPGTGSFYSNFPPAADMVVDIVITQTT